MLSFVVNSKFRSSLDPTKMYNFLKSLFGIPSDESHSSRPYDNFSPGTGENEWPQNDQNEFDDNRNIDIFTSGFHHPIFSGSMDIHKYIENFIGEMERSFDFFGFHNQPSISWEEQTNLSPELPQAYEQNQNSGSLRDSYLKSPGGCNTCIANNKVDIDLDGKIKVEDVESLLNNQLDTLTPRREFSPNNSPKVYSKSVYIRTIRHPDGSIETIKKVRDQSGNEETTITHDTSPNSPSPMPVLPEDDASGMSIFKKFFPF